MEELASKIPNMKVKVLPKIYPQGGEKVLVYHSTGKVISVGQLPIDVGCVVINCTTVAGIGRFILTGMPLVEKCITVDGGAVKEPKNVIVPIGVALKDVFDFCGGFKEEPFSVLYGGPMMGISIPDINLPVIKQTNAILALTKKETNIPKETNCIRCGACVNTCPFGLAPASIAAAYDKKDLEGLLSLSVKSCMECGCCSFVCPANRPLVQINKLSKQFINEEMKKEVKK
jgi:electron transport complex protein RnfC